MAVNLDEIFSISISTFLPDGTPADNLDTSIEACRAGKVPNGTKQIIRSGTLTMVSVYKAGNDLFTIVKQEDTKFSTK